MSGKRAYKKYSDDFKSEAVKLVTVQGMKLSDVAKDLGIGIPTLSSWLTKAQKGNKGDGPGKPLINEQEKKIRELEQQVKRLTMEREILKKAMAYFVELPK